MSDGVLRIDPFKEKVPSDPRSETLRSTHHSKRRPYTYIKRRP